MQIKNSQAKKNRSHGWSMEPFCFQIYTCTTGKMTGCCAFGCHNRSEKGFKMYRFPANIHRKKIWENTVSRLGWKSTSSSFLCQVGLSLTLTLSLCLSVSLVVLHCFRSDYTHITGMRFYCMFGKGSSFLGALFEGGKAYNYRVIHCFTGVIFFFIFFIMSYLPRVRSAVLPGAPALHNA